MDSKFVGYRKKSNDEIAELWKSAYFTFDTNFLLNLYRYSESSREDLFEIIKKLNSRIFITNQVVFEFSKNRYENLNDIIKSNRDFLKNIEKISDELSSNGSPFLSKLLTDKFSDLIVEINSEISENIKTFESYFSTDTIFDQINKIFNKKVLEEFTDEQILNIEKVGDIRYSNKVPPGYMDSKKPENKFGDLIIWNEIINFSKNKAVSVVFISDDSKEDWIWKLKDGKAIGARPELIQEFIKETNNSFHIYNSNSFAKFGSKYFHEKLNSKTIDEILKVNQEVKLSQYYEYLQTLNVSEIEEKLKILSPREADLIRLNLGLNGKDKFSLKEIAEIFGLKLSRAIQIRSSAIRQLRNIENHK